MNKKILAAVLLILSALNLQASGQKCTYEFNCNNPQQITRVYCDGREEIIHLQQGENSREKIRELQNNDRAGQARFSNNARANNENMQTFACFSSMSEFVNVPEDSNAIPVFYKNSDDFDKMINGTESQCKSQMLAMLAEVLRARAVQNNNNN